MRKIRTTFLLPALILLSTVPILNAEETSSPVLVELFTSQGCSNCPSADALLSNWGLAAFKRGEIIPLALHVDYWNKLGWVDAFSSEDYTNRQKAYAAHFKSDSIYTPQMVVAGQSEFIGSNLEKAKEETARLHSKAPFTLQIVCTPQIDTVRIVITGKPVLNAKPAGKNLHLFYAVFQNGFITEVSAGENSGRTLKNDFVVRKLLDLGPPEKDSSAPFKKTVDIPWNSHWNCKTIGVAIFLQDTNTMKVYAAQKVYPLESSKE